MLLMAVLIGAMGFYVLYPLGLILINSFNVSTIAEPPVYGLKAWQEAFREAGIWRSLLNSIKIGLALQMVALPLGIFLSWLIARTNILIRQRFRIWFLDFLFSPCAGDDIRLDAPARSEHRVTQQKRSRDQHGSKTPTDPEK